MTNSTTPIGERVQQFRARRDWSLTQLGERAGLDHTTIWKIERGRTPNPGAETLAKIAHALELDLTELTGERKGRRSLVTFVGNFAGVPVEEVRVSADAAAWRETDDYVAIDTNVAKRSAPRAVVVTGDCLVPDVEPGDVVVFDQWAHDPQDGQMVVVRADGALLVKWAVKTVDGSLCFETNSGDRVQASEVILEGVVIQRDRRWKAPRRRR